MKITKFAGRWGFVPVDISKFRDPVVTSAPEVVPVHRPAKYVPHAGTAKPPQNYTGDNVLGIGALHKSNLQPIFSKEEAVDQAHMRR